MAEQLVMSLSAETFDPSGYQGRSRESAEMLVRLDSRCSFVVPPVRLERTLDGF
ncbi:hypothetical protein [Saccharopolyspora sp. NPDC050642]|uniref:hypothetical protein n=1 Tax=Saccharopolyspora sp. NPDC050642 TaxID=3157099 RepID=UPI0033FB90F0